MPKSYRKAVPNGQPSLYIASAMAKGYDQHQQRLGRLSTFGKDLTRRARSKCELCETAGERLAIFELPPAPAEPDFQRCLFLCPICHDQLGGAAIDQPERWRCLNNTAWSELPAVQAAAVIILRRLGVERPWASELLETLVLDPETETLLGSA